MTVIGSTGTITVADRPCVAPGPQKAPEEQTVDDLATTAVDTAGPAEFETALSDADVQQLLGRFD